MAFIFGFFFVFDNTNAMGLFYLSEKYLNEKTSQLNTHGQKKNTLNSQNIPLLESYLSYNSIAPKGGGDTAIVNNDSLMADSGPLGTIADIEDAESNNGQISIYVVREGDSISQIAKMFNVSVNTIIWSNDISRGDTIKPGQTLIILPISGVKYEIKKGDTLKSIAKKFSSDTEEIMQYNDIYQDSQLAVGTTIIIPNGEIAPAQPQKTSSKGTGTLRGVNGPSYAGYYIKPLNGGYKSQGLHGYNGVDLADTCGTPVFASANGDVIRSKSDNRYNGGYGNNVIISHGNGTQTLYAHLLSVVVSTGWHVAQGQLIGYVGSTGKSTGCHLHFEIRGARNPF